MSNDIKNWYESIGNHAKKPKLDKNYNKHHIQPNSMILCLGGTGSGKTNSLIDFISKKNEAFYKIIIFSGSSTDEPLYNFLQEKLPEIEVYNDINELPSLSEFDDDEKDQEKLIIFDDFINLKKSEMKKINEYLTAGRKAGFSCWLMSQDYKSTPKIITRNCHYFLTFRLNDNVSINNIIRNHNINGVNKDIFKEHYINSTSKPRNFFLIDLKTPATHLRHNFTDILKY